MIHSCFRGALAALSIAVLSIHMGAQARGVRAQPEPGRLRIPVSLEQAAIAQGRVRVIVALNVDVVPEGLLTAGGRTRQRSEIASAQLALLNDLAGSSLGTVKRFGIVPGMALDVDLATLDLLARHPLVAHIEEDAVAAPTLAESAAIIGAPTVWSSGYTGTGQTVAILDTGVDRTHAFFGGRIVSEACYSTTSAASGSTAVCTPESTATGAAMPCAGISSCDHGTHVAGIAAGSGTTFHGVAPGATIIAIQVFSQFEGTACGSGPSPCVLSFTSDQVLALERVYALRNTFDIAAANMSLGGGGFTSQAECDAANTSNQRKAIIDTLRAAGVATVIASGNNGFVNAISSPACISSAVSVGSTTDGSNGASPADQVSAFTNSASFLTLLAPGHFITSSVPGGGFATFAGTSMAAPQVSGAWAVLKSRSSTASVTQALSALTTTGVGVFDPGNGLTKPRISLPNAMDALASATCTYSLSATSAVIPAPGGSGTVSVLTQTGCAWMAASNHSFITVTGGGSGSGPGTVSYAVGVNTDTSDREGTLTIAGHTFTVVQSHYSGSSPDLNGDGKTDLVWHHQGDGRISAWLMNGTTLIDGTLLTPAQVPETNWKIVGTGDLDGDSHTDLVWQHIADGRISAWLMNGLTAREGTLFSTPQVPDTDWRIRSVGDLNGDGKADLFWQHLTTGQIAVWLMNGLTVLEGTLLSPSAVTDLDWQIVGTGDFDANGSRDLVWHHQTDGRVAIWFMDGLAQVSGSLTNPGQVPDVNWKIRAVADLNGDKRPDLVWQHATDGRVSAWLMNGLNLIDGTLLTPSVVADTNWHIVGPR